MEKIHFRYLGWGWNRRQKVIWYLYSSAECRLWFIVKNREEMHTFNVASSLFRTQTPWANVYWQKLNSLHISPSHRITSCSWNGVMSVPCVQWKESRGQNFAGVCGECVRLCQTLGSVKMVAHIPECSCSWRLALSRGDSPCPVHPPITPPTVGSLQLLGSSLWPWCRPEFPTT